MKKKVNNIKQSKCSNNYFYDAFYMMHKEEKEKRIKWENEEEKIKKKRRLK